MANNQYVNKVVYGSTTLIDISDTTAIASDVAQGRYFYTANGQKVQGTSTGGDIVVTDVANATGMGAVVTADSVDTLITKNITQNGTYTASSDNADGYSSVTVSVSGGGATQHTIHLEFSDSTDTDIPVYYNDSVLGTIITAYAPNTWTYSSKTVNLAQLDSVTWYDKQTIPIGVQLIDFTKLKSDYVIDSNGAESAEQWYACTDYTPIASGMTFAFSACRWFYGAFYDSSKAFISSFYIYNYTTESPYNPNVGDGIFSSEIPSNAAYMRFSSVANPDEHELSLIRTA